MSGKVLYAMVDLPAEVHSIPGHLVGEKFTSDCAHEMSKDCACRPVTHWNSAAHPRPLYEHRNYSAASDTPRNALAQS